MTIRRYYLTIATTWYDSRTGRKREVETHYSVVLSGPIRDNRRKLSLRSEKDTQLMLFKRYGRLVPLCKLKARFEREERASKVDREISVKARSMWYKGKHWGAKPLPSTQIGLRLSKAESRASKYVRGIVEDREARRKRNRALLDRLMKNGIKKR